MSKFTVDQLVAELEAGKMFDGSITEPDGYVETGVHCIYEFSVWKTVEGLAFVCHDDPDELCDYEDVVRVFGSKNDDSLMKQLSEQGLI